MEFLLRDGDYVPDGAGSLVKLTGAEEVLQRALFRLSARRGSFPLLPELGSGLYLLGREAPESGSWRPTLRYFPRCFEPILAPSRPLSHVVFDAYGTTSQAAPARNVVLHWPRPMDLKPRADFARDRRTHTRGGEAILASFRCLGWRSNRVHAR